MANTHRKNRRPNNASCSDYISFQQKFTLPFPPLFGLTKENYPDSDFKAYLDDMVSVIGTIRMMNSINKPNAYYDIVKTFIYNLLGGKSSIWHIYRNYYSYTKDDLNLFPGDIPDSFIKELDVYYLPDIPDNENLSKLTNSNSRKYINTDIARMKAYNEHANSGLEALKSQYDCKNYDYMLLFLRFHTESNYNEQAQIHTALLLVNHNSDAKKSRNNAYFLDLFNDAASSEAYAISAFSDLSIRQNINLYFSIYNQGGIPQFKSSFQNVWSWFIIALEVLNPDYSRCDIVKVLLSLNQINRIRLLQQFMFYIFTKYDKEFISKYMISGIEESPITEASAECISSVWETTYPVKITIDDH